LSRQQAKHIYAIAERFIDATGVLEVLCSAICDRDYSRSKLLQDVAFVKKFIIPLLKESIKTITTAATVLSPLAQVKYVHERNENKRKREVAMSKKLKYSLQKEMIVRDITEGTKINNKHDMSTPPAKRYRRSAVCVSPTVIEQSINLPAPQSGTAYNKIEVVAILSKILDAGTCAATFKAILEHHKRYDVPCSRNTIYRLLRNHNYGLIISGDFRGPGQPPICCDFDMKQIAESLDGEVGKTYDKSDVKVMIKEVQTEKLEKAGYKNIVNKSISDSTLMNYSALLADEGNIAISQSYISKSNTRYAAENSIRGSIANLGVITATHFISVEEEDADIRAEMKTLPKSTRKLYDIVSDFLGTAVYPVEPYMLYSTDDTTEYIFEGTKKVFSSQPKILYQSEGRVLSTNVKIISQCMGCTSN